MKFIKNCAAIFLAIGMLFAAGCREAAIRNPHRVVVIIDTLSFAQIDGVLSFYDRDLFRQSVPVQSSPLKIIFQNAAAVNEIVFSERSGRDFKFFAEGGDSLSFSFIGDAPSVAVHNRKSKKWDQNFNWMSATALHGEKLGMLEDYKYLALAINDPASGMGSDPEMIEELERAKAGAELELVTERAFIDSLSENGHLSKEAAQYFIRANEFSRLRLTLDKNGKLNLENDSASHLLFSKFLRLDSRKDALREKDFQSALDQYASELVESGEAHSYDSLKNLTMRLSIDSAASKALKFKIVLKMYETYSEESRKDLLDKLKNEGLNRQAEHLADIHPPAEIFSIGLTVLNQEGKLISSSLLPASAKGKKIYVDIWAGWCGPCISEFPKLGELEAKYSDRVEFIYFSIDRDAGSWQRAIKAHFDGIKKKSFYFDASQQADLLKALKISSIPRYILFDEAGKLLHSNAPKPNDPQLERMLLQKNF